MGPETPSVSASFDSPVPARRRRPSPRSRSGGSGACLLSSNLRSLLAVIAVGLSLISPNGSAAAYEVDSHDSTSASGGPSAPSVPPPGSRIPVLDELSAEQRDLRQSASRLRTMIIGYSVEGRPIEVVRFGAGPQVRLIVAGIHGGSESNTTALARELVAYLTTQPQTVPPNVSLYVLPLLNPDGAARAAGPQGRANARGVDLNRNWPAVWQPEWSRSGCWNLGPTTGGERPASEPETMSLIQFISAAGVEALISYHSAALGIFAGGQPPEALSLDLAEALAAVSNYPYPPLDTGCVFTGQLIDWAANNGIAAVDIELHNHRDSDFDLNLAVLRAFLGWEG